MYAYTILIVTALLTQVADGVPGTTGEYEAVFSRFAAPIPPFILPLPPATPESIRLSGDDERGGDIIPGQVVIPISCLGQVGVEAEHMDTPSVVFGPVVAGTYEGDFVYFPPNPDYPTGCVKILDDTTIILVKTTDGKIIPYEMVAGWWGNLVWVPVDAYGFPWFTPGWIVPENHDIPGNGFPAWTPPANPDENVGVGL